LSQPGGLVTVALAQIQGPSTQSIVNSPLTVPITWSSSWSTKKGTLVRPGAT
jgi:hypothetical protein